MGSSVSSYRAVQEHDAGMGGWMQCCTPARPTRCMGQILARHLRPDLFGRACWALEDISLHHWQCRFAARAHSRALITGVDTHSQEEMRS